MKNQTLKSFYDYDVNEAYSKINSLNGKVIIFKDSKHDYPFTSARLEGVEKVNILDSDGYALNITLKAPVIESKEKPMADEISRIIKSYETKSPEERAKIQKKSDSIYSLLYETMELEEKLKEVKKIPRWKFLERRKMRKKIISDYASVVVPAVKILKPLGITKPEDLLPMSIDYGESWGRRVSSKEMVDTLEEVSV